MLYLCCAVTHAQQGRQYIEKVDMGVSSFSFYPVFYPHTFFRSFAQEQGEAEHTCLLCGFHDQLIKNDAGVVFLQMEFLATV